MLFQRLSVYPVFDPVDLLFKRFYRIPGKDVDPFLRKYAAFLEDADAGPAIEAMREIGCDISGHRTRAVETKMVADARYLLVMTAGHQREIVARLPLAGHKVFLGHGFGVQGPCTVRDPVGMPLETYRRTRDEIVQALGDFLLYLAENGEISH